MNKEVITVNNKNYIVGFKESLSGDYIECHIFKKYLFWYRSIYSATHLKKLFPNNQKIAKFTIANYENNSQQKIELLNDIYNKTKDETEIKN
jgi:hypothetical protein